MFITGMLAQLRRLEAGSADTPCYRDGIAELRRRIIGGATTGDATLDEVILFRTTDVFAFADAVRRIEAGLVVHAPCPVVVMYGDDEHIAGCTARGTRLWFDRLTKDVSIPTDAYRTFDPVSGSVRTIESTLPLGGLALKEPALFASRIFVGQERSDACRSRLVRKLGMGAGDLVDIVHITTQQREDRSRDDAYLAAKRQTEADRRIRVARELKIVSDLC